MMNKVYRVKNHKKTPRIYNPITNIKGYFDNISTFGEKPMFVWKESGETKNMNYGEFVEMTKNLTLGVEEKFGKSAGVKIAILGESSPFWFASYLSIIASGNVAVPMDKELSPEAISDFFEFGEIKAVYYSSSFNEMIEGIADGHKTLTDRLPMDSSVSGTNVTSFDCLIKLGESCGREFDADADEERCCELLFTSGTTGTSKCVMLSQRNIFTTVSSCCESVDFSTDDAVMSILPLHHTYELTATYLAGTNYGMKVCINDSLRYILKNLKEFQPTAIVVVPLVINTMYKKILSEAKKGGKDKILPVATKIANALGYVGIDLSEKLFKDVREAFGGRLEKIVCGGAALSPELIPIFEAFGISIYEGYGITECSPLVAVSPYYARKPGSIGPAVNCCEVRIEGLETNDQGYLTGEIQVKGSNVMLGYMNNEEANAAAFTEDGWFRTGDVGYLDKDKYIHITGRMKSVIVLDNGKNVFPEEIEEYLAKIEYIAESVVVGREEGDGTKLVAVILPNYEKYPEMQEADLRAEIQKAITELNKKLPSFKQIHKLDFRKTDFERTTTKKIKRYLVK
ncbi:MAG: hypothetical protein E7672_05270 [Ruminococcaceae bacterium]|nr:hypothetical protein [Oscillospiraceae bacterium]